MMPNKASKKMLIGFHYMVNDLAIKQEPNGINVTIQSEHDWNEWRKREKEQKKIDKCKVKSNTLRLL